VTLQDRADAYALAFPKCEGSMTVAGGGRWLYGHWSIGANYRATSSLYGSYPPSFVARLTALFQDVPEADWLHAFSGSLPCGAYVRLDCNPASGAELLGEVYDAAQLARGRLFALVAADPPYSHADAAKYGVRMVDRRRATLALAAVTKPGGWLAWLDVVRPMYRKALWHYCGAISVERSTNHRDRMLRLFQRTETPA
jgi:hypothetical protein